MSKTKPLPPPELPFNMEEKVASRQVWRPLTKNCDHLRKIHLDCIRIRPGFNARRQKGLSEELHELGMAIPDLADKIYASNGPAEPLIGDITTEGFFYQTEGERRIGALRHLVRTGREIYPNGNLVTDVLILLNPPGTTDHERKRKVLTTGDKLALKPMDRAYHYLSFKIDDGMTHEEIARDLGISRQTVDNYIKATELPESVQDDIDEGRIHLSAAIATLRTRRAPVAGTALVDTNTGEVIEDGGEKKVAPPREPDGDEDEFLDKLDNSINSPGSMGGPKEGGSGAHVVGTDSIYILTQRKAAIKQFINRYNVLTQQKLEAYLKDERTDANVEDEVVDQLLNEYDVKVK